MTDSFIYSGMKAEEMSRQMVKDARSKAQDSPTKPHCPPLSPIDKGRTLLKQTVQRFSFLRRGQEDRCGESGDRGLERAWKERFGEGFGNRLT